MSRALLSLLILSVSASAQFSFRQAGSTGLELVENGKPVYVYNYGEMLKPGSPENLRRAGYLHPVYLPDGTVVTDDFNDDHPHHRGISWIWPQVLHQGRCYDMWGLKALQLKHQPVRWNKREATANRATLSVVNGWFLDGRQVMEETVEISTGRVQDGKRVLDFVLRFEPAGDPVALAGSTEDNKAFGGFTFRSAPRDGGTKGTVIRTEKGVSAKDGVFEPHVWAQVEGRFQGKRGSYRIDDDPSNPGYPNNGWLLRHSFALLNISYPGLKPVTLKRGAPLVLKYRVTLVSGK
jgi:hypothetical protein